LEAEAACLEDAVAEVITAGCRTVDLGGKLTTHQMADEIISRL
jgi:isocitrate/isopropylmalate dehydrogenase